MQHSSKASLKSHSLALLTGAGLLLGLESMNGPSLRDIGIRSTPENPENVDRLNDIDFLKASLALTASAILAVKSWRLGRRSLLLARSKI